MRSTLLLAACGLAWLAFFSEASSRAKQDKDNVRVDKSSFDLVFLGESRPIYFRVHIQVDGKPIQTVWTAYLKKWFDYLDKNGDGMLDAKEIEYAPPDQAMLQLMRQGGGFFRQGKPLRPKDFDKGAKEKATFEDFVAYYKLKAGPVQVAGGAGGGETYNATSDVLFKLLDKNGDGKLSQMELEAAYALMKLDTDDDEYVSPPEIAPASFAQPDADAVVVPEPSKQKKGVPVVKTFYAVDGKIDVNLANLLVERYSKDKDRQYPRLQRRRSLLPKDLFDRLDTNKDDVLDLAEMASWPLRGPDFTFTLGAGQTDRPGLELVAAEKKLTKSLTTIGGSQLVTLDKVQIQLLGGGGRPAPAGLDNLQYLFQEVDTKMQGFVTLKQIEDNQQFQFLAEIFPLLDRNGDGKLTEKEVAQYVTLQAGGTGSVMSLSTSDQGKNLFKLLDANGDGKLSPRELKTAWARLKHLDTDGDGCIEGKELVRQFQIAFEGGQPGGDVVTRRPGMDASRRPVDSLKTPLWFSRMDRNGDGDVSFREFLGTRDEFNAIDTDGDGLISAEEAERYDERMRAKKQ